MDKDYKDFDMSGAIRGIHPHIQRLRKIKVYLYSIHGAMLIVPYPTGIVYQNQVGGGANYQRQVEGFIVPIEQFYLKNSQWVSEFEQTLSELTFDKSRLNEADADRLDELFCQNQTTNFMRFDRTKIHDSCEAWLHVLITDNEHAEFENLDISNAVLTWSNSD